MRAKELLPLLLCAVLAGCATPSRDLGTYIDPYTGLRTDIITENLLEGAPQSREMLWLNASRVFKNWGRVAYYLEVAYAAREEAGYLDIGPGTTLTVIADGRTLRFDGIGSTNLRKKKKGVLTENAIYQASAEDLHAIANAQRVAVRVAGKNGQLERDFAPANCERFRQFTSKFVPVPK